MLHESYRCHVFYIDYGNDEYVVSSELKHLTKKFCELPMQAILCSLHDLYPTEEVCLLSTLILFICFCRQIYKISFCDFCDL